MPVCQSFSEVNRIRFCLHTIFGIARVDLCHDPCNLPEYTVSYREQFLPGDSQEIGQVNIYFFNVEEQDREEYVLFDWEAILSSVGGSLGLFLGFSFFDFAMIIVKWAVKYLMTWLSLRKCRFC